MTAKPWYARLLVAFAAASGDHNGEYKESKEMKCNAKSKIEFTHTFNQRHNIAQNTVSRVHKSLFRRSASRFSRSASEEDAAPATGTCLPS